ncbi:reverse transcriptase family protein [Pedobacter gandavensis]|uniref:reverse transcriptase family protein n=1 Tax=Pedobacter gandavensis TaxID=2679963 RepID=UPI00292CC508|nr:reverse transcriptase family protein [Pedobacter gandavensis]
MKFPQYARQFRIKATNAGFSEDNIQRCLKYAEPLLTKNLPIIYNTTNLAALVAYKKEYLKNAASDPKFFYRSFLVKKKNGKFRRINEPLPSLKEIQLWILNQILYTQKVSKFAKAYIKSRSLIDNVKLHVGKEKVLNLDLEDFFPSIKREYVEQIFSRMGYSSNVSNLLSKLCTLNESLPQGAPTSPYLSNLYMINIDESIATYCLPKNIRFTRYADDLAFSGTFDEIELINFVEQTITKYHLKLNPEKTQVMKRNVRQIVTGIVVNTKMQTPRASRDKIRLEVYYLKKYGLNSHLEHTKNTKANYILHLAGKINYALSLNPDDEDLQKYSEYLKQFKHDDKTEQTE